MGDMSIKWVQNRQEGRLFRSWSRISMWCHSSEWQSHFALGRRKGQSFWKLMFYSYSINLFPVILHSLHDPTPKVTPHLIVFINWQKKNPPKKHESFSLWSNRYDSIFLCRTKWIYSIQEPGLQQTRSIAQSQPMEKSVPSEVTWRIKFTTSRNFCMIVAYVLICQEIRVQNVHHRAVRAVPRCT